MPQPNVTQPTSKEKLDKKLDKALEESFPGSDPVSISQPAPNDKPKGTV